MMPAEVPARVLVVDDDAAIQRLMVLLFERQGWSVFAASDGNAAMNLLSGEFPDVLCLDLMLPARSGFDVLDWISSRNPALLRRVIVVTAASTRIVGELRHGDSVWSIVRKPFDIGKLVGDVRACAAAHRSASAETPPVVHRREPAAVSVVN